MSLQLRRGAVRWGRPGERYRDRSLHLIRRRANPVAENLQKIVRILRKIYSSRCAEAAHIYTSVCHPCHLKSRRRKDKSLSWEFFPRERYIFA